MKHVCALDKKISKLLIKLRHPIYWPSKLSYRLTRQVWNHSAHKQSTRNHREAAQTYEEIHWGDHPKKWQTHKSWHKRLYIRPKVLDIQMWLHISELLAHHINPSIPLSQRAANRSELRCLCNKAAAESCSCSTFLGMFGILWMLELSSSVLEIFRGSNYLP